MECVLESHPKHGGCCCQCKLRVETIAQWTDNQVGWACAGPIKVHDENIVYVGEFEHGMCELFTTRQPNTAPVAGAEREEA